MRIPAPVRYVALPASAALLALTGCASNGSGGGPAASSTPKATPLKLVQAAYATTTAAKSARIAMRFTAGTDGRAASIDGIEDFANQRAESTASIPGMGTVEQREIGSDSYIKISLTAPGAPKLFNGVKPWMHGHNWNDQMPAGLSSIMGGGGSDPADFVKLLTSVTSSVTAVGTDDVRGQESTHYRMTFDAAKIRKLDAQMGDCSDEDTSDANTPLNLWLDSQGRVTRMQMTNNGATTESGAPSSSPTAASQQAQAQVQATQTMTMTIEFYDYGVPVTVQRPPADQTQDEPDMTDMASPSPCPTS
jgi:hypothetical protein